MKNLLRPFAESRFRISTQLYVGIFAAVTLTSIASLVAWFSFEQVGTAQRGVNEHSVPQMAAAFRIAQQANALVVAAPRLVAAPTPVALANVTASIEVEREAFVAELGKLINERGLDDIRKHGDELINNIQDIEQSVVKRFELEERRLVVNDEVVQLRDELSRTLGPAIDDQLFFTMTGYREMQEPPASRERHLSEDEVARYRHLSDLLANATHATQLLANAFNLSDAPLLGPLEERFRAVADGIERNLAALGAAANGLAVRAPLTRLRELGLGLDNGFELRRQELALTQEQQKLLADNDDLIEQLATEVNGRVEAAGDNAAGAARVANQTIDTGKNVLLGLNVVSIVGAVLIAWLFVGKVLLGRIERLSARMRGMADGDLESAVDISGRDEVADMAHALEVFRRHALEVQRLNLVEKLAEELRGKNDQLESVIADLQRMQDQMVAQEKLAALGELTAGVAHEIKNPLNFVKNFAEASEELLEELRETLAEVGESPLDEQQELIDELNQDLTDNMGRIRHHSERADRIVRDMLMMGRNASERQATDLNALIEEHAALAFHSVRATDPESSLHMEYDLDASLGEVDMVAQDFGRVLLNLVTNACYATNERRLSETDPSYVPTLHIKTRRLADRVLVAIRDNGSGIPPDVVDKIFNPFFTTKPTDKGTGLGLAISNDIVKQHGGTMRVESEPGMFTEMTVELPVAEAAVAAS